MCCVYMCCACSFAFGGTVVLLYIRAAAACPAAAAAVARPALAAWTGPPAQLPPPGLWTPEVSPDYHQVRGGLPDDQQAGHEPSFGEYDR